MTGIAILIVAYFFGAVTFLAAHAVIVIPVALAAWALLFVPKSTWAKLRGRQSQTAATVPAAVAHRDDIRGRELVHTR